MNNELVKLMDNQGTKKEILDSLYELSNFAIMNVSNPANEYKRGIDERIKRLNDNLKNLKIMEISYAEKSKFDEKVMSEIIEAFKLSIDLIFREGELYVTKIEEKNYYLSNVANFYDLIQ